MTNDKIQMTKEITLAKDWILSSGIQNTKGRNKGAFNSWFDLTEKEYAYAYSEITGYGITTLLYLAKYFGEKKYLTQAASAADWLISRASHPSGAVKTRDYYGEMKEKCLYSFDSEKIYAFDNGMVLYGMINLYKEKKDARYLEFAVKIAEFLRKNMLRADGLLFPIYDAKKGQTEESRGKWSSQTGSYHSKIALGFTDLFDITRNEAYKDAALNLCLKCKNFQEKTGRFITSRLDSSTHLHPHAYSAEGLVYAGVYFGRNDFIEPAACAVKWALDNQRHDGGIPKMFDGKKFIPYYRSDTLAQILRLGVVLYGLGRLEDKYISQLGKIRDKILEFQYLTKDDQCGGFFYGTCLDGSKKDHLNSWCTMFALQALAMYDDLFLKGKRTEKPELFI